VKFTIELPEQLIPLNCFFGFIDCACVRVCVCLVYCCVFGFCYENLSTSLSPPFYLFVFSSDWLSGTAKSKSSANHRKYKLFAGEWSLFLNIVCFIYS